MLKFEAVQKCANLVDLEQCCKTNISLLKWASLQPRTSTVQFALSPCTDHYGYPRCLRATRQLDNWALSRKHMVFLGHWPMSWDHWFEMIFIRYTRSRMYSLYSSGMVLSAWFVKGLFPSSSQFQRGYTAPGLRTDTSGNSGSRCGMTIRAWWTSTKPWWT